LLIPYRGWGDLWFSEGLATYYQNILQARTGMLSEREMWQNIYAGMVRGLEDTAQQRQPLKEISETLHSKGGFMRVYWSGARYFFELDVRLRRQSGGSLTLDKALERLNRCCSDDRLTVPQIVTKLDRLNEVILFRSLYQEARESLTLKPFDKLFASLGISIQAGRVTLQPAGPGAELRRQIAKTRVLPQGALPGILTD
jgi:predicted metalloprotease with PDZ domain